MPLERSDQTEADLESLVHLLHGSSIQTAKAPDEALPIDRPDLIQDDGRRKREPARSPLDDHVGRMRWRGEFGSDSCHDRDRAVSVADIVLNDQSRPGLLDLMPPGRIKFH